MGLASNLGVMTFSIANIFQVSLTMYDLCCNVNDHFWTVRISMSRIFTAGAITHFVCFVFGTSSLLVAVRSLSCDQYVFASAFIIS